eukprot:TRINITY_DN13034_c0_g2_i1.p1 TRINITY_DN13034_c0_g2~~TRINITY_DN13034_c0_g2_i1.p1  ORF type:complete len:132 (+),score=2.90 TRINITY_DN13034_c0_g2_i1:498-893(+)
MENGTLRRTDSHSLCFYIFELENDVLSERLGIGRLRLINRQVEVTSRLQNLALAWYDYLSRSRDLIQVYSKKLLHNFDGLIKLVLLSRIPSFLLERKKNEAVADTLQGEGCLLYTSPSPRDGLLSRMPSSA